MSSEQQARSNHKELCEALNRKNWLRAFVSSAALALIIPVFLLIVHFLDLYGIHTRGVKIYLVVVELFQIFMGITGFRLISQEETDKLGIYFRVYFYLTPVFLAFAARSDLAYSGSIYIYMAAGIYAVCVPVFVNTERKCFSAVYSLLMIITAFSAKGVSRELFEIIIFEAAAYVICRYISDSVVSHEMLTIKLRARTVTSEKDPLTGLNNRRGLDRKASVLWPYCIKNGLCLGIIEIDIDFFKKYNDKFGHPAGDRCLKQVAAAIKKASSGYSEIVARTGGEEFMVFVQGVDEKKLVELAMQIRKSIEELAIRHACVSVSNNITVSMGAAFTDSEKIGTFDELYEEADKALYYAKTNGRNCIVLNKKIYGRMKNGIATAISV